MFLVSCYSLVFFSVVLPMFLHTCWVFSFPRMLGKNSLLLRFGFEIVFRGQIFVFAVLLLPCVFRWSFAYVFAYLLGSSFPRMLGKNSLLLRFGFEIPFRERTLVFVVLLHPSVFWWCFA